MRLENALTNVIVGISITVLSVVGSLPVVAEEKNNSITIFTGALTEDEVKLPIPDFESAFQVGISYNRSIKSFDRIKFEFDTSLYRHFGEQFHWEITAAVMFRYYILKNRLSFAVGDGLSYASEIPDWERRRHIHTSQLLNLILLELAYDFNQKSAIALRWHHRSGMWGLFNGVEGGSNSAQLGLRYKF
jgi:hypothetical protein